MLHFIYIFSTNISTEYFKYAAHSPLFSSKCRLFYNATFFGSGIIQILHTGVLKFKLNLRCQKVNHKIWSYKNLNTKNAVRSLDYILFNFQLASGVDSRVVVWVREFLVGRTQRVRVGGKLSKEVKVTPGVLQGSV
jgi:hypothetical protein